MTRNRNRPITSVALVGLLAVASVQTTSAAQPEKFTRDVVTVDVPDVTLINQQGDEVRLQEILLGDRPVFVDFIFATCTTICPVLSAGYASLQRKLGDDHDRVHLVSFTIDPEHDGPEELSTYLDRYGARPGWQFLTGTREDINQVMRGFDAFVPDKMSHKPLTFIRSPVDGSWVRLYGFAGSRDLMAELELAEGGAESSEVQQ